MRLADYDIYQQDNIKPLIFGFCDEIYCLVITHSEIIINKLFKHDYPIVLNKIKLQDKETIAHISDAEFCDDRVFFCYLTSLGHITMNCVALPTDIDPQIHIESVLLNDSKSSFISNFNLLPNFIQMTKNMLSLSSDAPVVSQRRYTAEQNKLAKIQIKNLQRTCEDTFHFSLIATHGDNLIFGSFILQDKWHNEKSRYVKLQKQVYWELNIIDQIKQFDNTYISPQDPGKIEPTSIELLDFMPYLM